MVLDTTRGSAPLCIVGTRKRPTTSYLRGRSFMLGIHVTR